MNHRIKPLFALSCLGALAIGCATSNDDSPIVAPPETAGVEATIDPSAIESPPWALPETGDLPPDPVATSSPAEVFDDVDPGDVAPQTDTSELFNSPTAPAKRKESQFQMLSQTFDDGGGSYRVSIKLDRHSGKTWRLDPASVSWLPIAEADEAATPQPAQSARYTLEVQRDESSNAPTQTFLRMDLVTGDAWLYTKQQGAWKSLTP